MSQELTWRVCVLQTICKPRHGDCRYLCPHRSVLSWWCFRCTTVTLFLISCLYAHTSFNLELIFLTPKFKIIKLSLRTIRLKMLTFEFGNWISDEILWHLANIRCKMLMWWYDVDLTRLNRGLYWYFNFLKTFLLSPSYCLVLNTCKKPAWMLTWKGLVL